MNYSNSIIEELEEEFKGIDFSLEEVEYEGTLPCFFIVFKSEKKLAKNWMRISDLIAINYQTKLTDEFSIWNIYLFFITKKPIGNDLKYLIENDTYSSRKIVIEGEYDIKEIIDKYILNKDIEINPSIIAENDFTPNPIIFNQVKNIETKIVSEKIKKAHAKIITEIKRKANEA